MPIQTIDLKKPPRYPKLGIFGATGVGKTTLLGTMPGRGLLIDVDYIEGGAYVLGDKAERIKAVTVDDWNQLDDIYFALVKEDWQALGLEQKPQWIAIDSITAMAVLARDRTLALRDRALAEGHRQITLQERGWIADLVLEFIYRMCRLPFVMIFIAHERTHGSEDGPEPQTVGPAVTATMLLALKTPLVLLGKLTAETNERGRLQRTLIVGPPDGDYIVKARVVPGKRLPDQIANPNLGEILRYMFADGPRPKAAKSNSLI